MQSIYIAPGFVEWLQRTGELKTKAVCSVIENLRETGEIDPERAAKNLVYFSRVVYHGHPYYRIEAYATPLDRHPAVFTCLVEPHIAYILQHGSLADISLSQMLTTGLERLEEAKASGKACRALGAGEYQKQELESRFAHAYQIHS